MELNFTKDIIKEEKKIKEKRKKQKKKTKGLN